MHRFQHRRRAAIWVDCAIHPGITMIPSHHPLVRELAARNAPDHVPESAELIILLQMHLDPYRPWPHVIGKRKRTLPLARRVGAREVLENWRGIVVGEW